MCAGLVAPELLNLIVEAYNFRNAVFNARSAAELQALTPMVRALVKNLYDYNVKELDIPTTHYLQEFVKRALPTYSNVEFLRLQTQEMAHTAPKQMMRKAASAHKPEHQMLSAYRLQSTLRFIVHGGRWGNQLQYSVGLKVAQAIADFGLYSKLSCMLPVIALSSHRASSSRVSCVVLIGYGDELHPHRSCFLGSVERGTQCT